MKPRALQGLGNFDTNHLYNCYINARKNNYEVFSLQNDKECWAGNGLSYQRFGVSNNCKLNGRGGPWANEVYKVNVDSLNFNKTVKFRNVLKENCSSYQPINNATELNGCTNPCFWSNSVCINPDECYICKCETIWSLGKDVFSCVKICGKPQLNFTYNGIMIKKLGCFQDYTNLSRTLPTLEDTSSVLDGNYKLRADAFGKCYRVATQKGFKYFALQDGGYCSADNDDSYKMFGASMKCLPDGKGGPWANEVYSENNGTLEVHDMLELRSFLYITFQISYWNFDKPAVNVSWEYFFPPFIILQSNYTSVDVVYSDPKLFQYKIMYLSEVGIHQSIVAVINNTICFICESFIDIPIKLYFENTAGHSWKSYKIIRKNLKKNCTSDELQIHSLDNTDCIQTCIWKSSICIDDEECYICTCEYGWRLDKDNYTCVDVDECTASNKPCNWTNSICINTNGSYLCACESGWLLDKNNDSCVDIDECAALYKPCNWTNSVCINTNGSYLCACEFGWLLDKNNDSCVDVDECTAPNIPCNWANSVCINTNGSYVCLCESGWLLEENNNICVDVDECTALNKACNLTNSVCTNTNGSYFCACESGWSLDKNNDSCVDIDECIASNKLCDWGNSVCTNTNGSYLCSCESGWLLDKNNDSCIDVDECTASNKSCNWTNSVCINTNGSYLCACDSGWSLNINNDSCVDVNECAALNKPCNWTNSVCINTHGSYFCACETGWSLNKNNDSCVAECTILNNPCKWKNAVCINNNNGYECIEGEWSIWSECSKTCGLGYKYSYLARLSSSKQNVKRVDVCMDFKCPVDWKWSSWVEYKSFYDSCGNCFTRRERFCSNYMPDADGGYDCFGLSQDFQYLESRICPVHGGWSQWSLWSSCSQPCQSGIQSRHRNCNNPLPKYDGLQCNGTDIENETCSSNKCKKVTVNLNIVFKDEDYIEAYSYPTNRLSNVLKYKIINAVQNLYNKFNKNVQFELVLHSLKDGEESQ